MKLRNFAPIVLALSFTACSSDPSTVAAPNPDSVAAPQIGNQDEDTPPAPPASVKYSLSLEDIKSPVPYIRQVSAEAGNGKVTTVELTGKDGSVVPGRIQEGRWQATGSLLPQTKYTWTVTAANEAGETVTKVRRFTTTAPPRTDYPAVTPLAGSVVGVGHPVIVYFDYDITEKQQVEKQLDVDTSNPVKGSWGWIDDRTIAYRPAKFWPAKTKISVSLPLAKTRIAKGVWVMEDREINFSTGREQILKITNSTHSMQVMRDGKNIRTVPVSMGKPGFTTRSGIKVISTKEVSRQMDSATVGIGGSEAYNLEVPYAMRLTATGEFIHGAPWSEQHQGYSNVSHGCTNISLSNAIWLMDNTLIGDPVITTGTGRPTETWNGLGGIWNFSYKEWADRSALN